MGTQLVMYDEEYHRINAVCDRLTKDANAKVVFLVDKNGQLISAAGQTQNIDTTSLGLVRLRVKKASDELGKIFDALVKKTESPGGMGSPFAEISDEDIDNLFSE